MGRSLGGGRCGGEARDPGAQGRSPRVHELDDGALLNAEPRRGSGIEADGTPAAAVEAGGRHHTHAEARSPELRPSHRGGSEIRCALAEHDAVDRLHRRRRDVAFEDVGHDARGIAVERVAEAPAAARLHEQDVAGLEGKAAHLAGQR